LWAKYYPLRVMSDCASPIRPTRFTERHSNLVRFFVNWREHALARAPRRPNPLSTESL